ncbi:hypothetical protein N2152v2_004927 [Parachlorella kessleri]
MAAEFPYPVFYNYPPYFTYKAWVTKALQVFVVPADEAGEFPLFHNQLINRKLSREARLSFLEACVQSGNGLWLDKGQRQCLILWKTVPEWSQTIYQWARGLGLVESVVTLDELANGDESRGTELEGIHREVLLRALRLLEQQGKAKMFKGQSADEEGVKFY